MKMTTMDTTTPTVVAVAAFVMATASTIHLSLSLMATFSVALCSQLMASLSSCHQPSPLHHPIKEEEEEEPGGGGGDGASSPLSRLLSRVGDDVGERGGRGDNNDDCGRGIIVVIKRGGGREGQWQRFRKGGHLVVGPGRCLDENDNENENENDLSLGLDEQDRGDICIIASEGD
jgi:hypothetical protein